MNPAPPVTKMFIVIIFYCLRVPVLVFQMEKCSILIWGIFPLLLYLAYTTITHY